MEPAPLPSPGDWAATTTAGTMASAAGDVVAEAEALAASGVPVVGEGSVAPVFAWVAPTMSVCCRPGEPAWR
jgi:hypothetical protein